MMKRWLAGIFVAGLVLAGCSDDDDNASDDTTTTEADDDTTTTTDADDDTTTTTEALDDTTTTTGSGGLDEAEVEAGVEEALANSLGGLGGSGSAAGLDDESMSCIVDGALDDPGLAEELLTASQDPTYVPSGDTMAATFGLLADCDSLDVLAQQYAEESGGTVTGDDAVCMFQGMAGLSAETWDAVMGGSTDPAALTDLMTVFSDCGIDPTTL